MFISKAKFNVKKLNVTELVQSQDFQLRWSGVSRLGKLDVGIHPQTFLKLELAIGLVIRT